MDEKETKFVDAASQELIQDYSPEMQGQIISAIVKNIFNHYNTKMEDFRQSMTVAGEQSEVFSKSLNLSDGGKVD